MVSKVINRTKFVEGDNPLLSYARKEETVVVEDGITSIYHKAFSGCYTIKKVVLPDSVSSIGDYAFRDCMGLEEIVIPDSVTHIGRNAFSGCESLKKVKMSEQIEDLDLSWFMRCLNLETIHIGKNIKNIWAFGIFMFWPNFKGFTIDEENEDFAIIDGNLFSTKENELIFYLGTKKGETEYEIPSFVTTIRPSAFKRCNKLKKLILSKKLKNGIENTAFATNLETIDLNGNKNFILEDGILYDKKREKLLRVLSNIKTYKTPETVKKICRYAFFNSNVEEIVLTDNVTTIEEGAIRGCENIKKIVIPASVKKIERFAIMEDNVTICCYRGTFAEKYAKEDEFRSVKFKIEYLE